MKISFDTEDINAKIKDGNIFFEPEVIGGIARFEKLYKEMTEHRKNLLEKITEEATKLDKNWKSIKSDNLTISLVARGSKYIIDMENLEHLDKSYYEIDNNPKYKINTSLVDGFMVEHGGLPLGVIGVEDRNQSITIKIKE